jgi:flavin-dependent dehydrogenase
VEFGDDGPLLDFTDRDGGRGLLKARFCVDASGFDRVLPRLLNLHLPSKLAIRESIFTQVIDNIDDDSYDRNKILIAVHANDPQVWLWLIPFSDGTSSLGVVGKPEFFWKYPGGDKAVLRSVMAGFEGLETLLQHSEYHQPVRRIPGYSSETSKLHGENYALLGTASGFLDPVFSSGVTVALKSSSLATGVLDRQLRGEAVDWDGEYVDPLCRGIETFRHFVSAWYEGSLQDIIFSARAEPEVQQMICSILAGYAWDENNPYVTQTERRLTALAEICRAG